MPEMSSQGTTDEARSDAQSRAQPPEEQRTSGAGRPTAPAGYELGEEIGRGGMGVVYRARDLALTREVAIKLLSDGYAPDSAVGRRFAEEAQITAQLQHPAIPAVHQTGLTPEGRPFLAMKLVKGRTLAQMLSDRTDLSGDRGHLLGIFEHVCNAVGYAHSHDIIHRDLKPGNVMVGAFDEVQVMDWGLAKVVTPGPPSGPTAGADADLVQTCTEIGPKRSEDMTTQTGSLLGTPAFMSPEQAGGEKDLIGPRSDVFGLGAILCVILTGEPPYRGTTTEAVRLQAIRGRLDDAFTRLDACRAEPELVALARRCLGELADRPANAAEVAHTVSRLRAAAEERARRAELERASAEVRVAEQRKRRRVWYGLAAALFLGTVASVLLAVLARQAEIHALEERDLKETARAEAVAYADKAQTAEAARRRELGRTAAAAAELAAGRGQWREALRLYETALEAGAGDEVALRLGRYDCRMALGEIRLALAELDALSDRSDLGRFAGPVLLRRVEIAMGMQRGTDPCDLARQALARGLSPADAAYARALLAQTAPEAIELLQQAMRLDPFHCRGLNYLPILLFITGRREELRQAAAQVRMVSPGSANDLICELLVHALDGDRSGAERVVSRLEKTGYAELTPLLRSFVDFILLAQRDDIFLGGVPTTRLGGLLIQYARIGQIQSRMAGEKDAASATPGGMRMFQLPLFCALAEAPPIKGATARGPFSLLTMLQNPAKLADLFTAIARAIPDGSFILLQGLYLFQAGRLREAEAAFRRARESPSWANHRRTAHLYLILVQGQLASRPGASAEELSAWKEKARESLREFPVTGKSPLPPGPMVSLLHVVLDCGEHELGLALVEAALRQHPSDVLLLAGKLNLEIELRALDRAESTGRALAALPQLRSMRSGADFDVLLNVPRAYHNADRPDDALRWCDRLHKQLENTRPDHPDLPDAWNGLGVVYWRMNRLDASIPLLERASTALRKARGERHRTTLQAGANLAINYRDAGRLQGAIPLLERTAAAAGADPSLRWVQGELLTAYAAAGKVPEGLKLANKMLAQVRKEHAANSTALGNALVSVGTALVQMKCWEQAEPVLREALRIREKAQPDAWTTFNVRSVLGEALAGQKKYGEAEPLLVQGFEGMKKRAAQITPPYRRLRLSEAAARLVSLYEALKKKDEAAKWRKEHERASSLG
jgi:tetratricopeptide (TPR) repeat protein